MSDVNSFGLTAEDMEQVYDDVAIQKNIDFSNQHLHWVGPSKICKICMKLVKEIE